MKGTIYSLGLTTLIAGTILTGCSNAGPKSDMGQGDMRDTGVASDGKIKLDTGKIPKPITNLFYADYPVTCYTNWYGYPAYDYDNDWYYNDPYLYSNNDPENYIVEFATDTLPYKVIYNKGGKRLATHKGISNLPAAINSAISEGIYKTWMLEKGKEEIFKDKDTDQLIVYKVNVTMGTEKHTLYYQQDGKLLKDKKVS